MSDFNGWGAACCGCTRVNKAETMFSADGLGWWPAMEQAEYFGFVNWANLRALDGASSATQARSRLHWVIAEDRRAAIDPLTDHRIRLMANLIADEYEWNR